MRLCPEISPSHRTIRKSFAGDICIAASKENHVDLLPHGLTVFQLTCYQKHRKVRTYTLCVCHRKCPIGMVSKIFRTIGRIRRLATNGNLATRRGGFLGRLRIFLEVLRLVKVIQSIFWGSCRLRFSSFWRLSRKKAYPHDKIPCGKCSAPQNFAGEWLVIYR